MSDSRTMTVESSNGRTTISSDDFAWLQQRIADLTAEVKRLNTHLRLAQASIKAALDDTVGGK